LRQPPRLQQHRAVLRRAVEHDPPRREGVQPRRRDPDELVLGRAVLHRRGQRRPPRRGAPPPRPPRPRSPQQQQQRAAPPPAGGRPRGGGGEACGGGGGGGPCRRHPPPRRAQRAAAPRRQGGGQPAMTRRPLGTLALALLVVATSRLAAEPQTELSFEGQAAHIQLQTMFASYGPRAKQVVVREKDGLRLSVPRGVQTPQTGAYSLFVLTGDCEVRL